MYVIVLRNREDPIGTWVSEERDLHADYRAAFGASSQDRVQAATLGDMGDNDLATLRQRAFPPGSTHSAPSE